MVEIFDPSLQILKHAFLPLAVAGDVGDRPDGQVLFLAGDAERTHAHPQPSPGDPVRGADAHLFLLPLALPRGFQQAEDHLGNLGIADEHPLDRPCLLQPLRAGQREVGGVAIDDAAALIDGDDAFGRAVADAARHGIVGAAVGKADHAGGERKRCEQADHGQKRQQTEDVGLRLRPAEPHEADRRGHHRGSDRQHQRHAPAPPSPATRLCKRTGLVASESHRHAACATSLSSIIALYARESMPQCLICQRQAKSPGESKFRRVKSKSASRRQGWPTPPGGCRAGLPPPGEAALELHDVADHLGDRLVVLDRNFVVDLDSGVQRPRQRRVLDHRHIVAPWRPPGS